MAISPVRPPRVLAAHNVAMLAIAALATPAAAGPTPSVRVPGGATVANFVNVPNLRDNTLWEAEELLAAYNLVVGRVRDVPDGSCDYIGLVASQLPAPGTLVSEGSAVNIGIGILPPFPCRIKDPI